jgi:catechol 2,3-dioxygenase-like lactoylglutathione lyase family enzyme
LPAYLIADTHITDHATYDEYKRQVLPVIERFGGRFIVRGGAMKVLEGTWHPAGARDNLAYDTGLPKTAPCPTGFTIGHNVTRKDEVDEVMEQARKAGARILKTAQDTFWGGYAGYFQDPDGHVWEIVWNPAFVPAN